VQVNAHTVGLPPATKLAVASPTPDPDRWAALGLLATAQFMVALDEYPGQPLASGLGTPARHHAGRTRVRDHSS
jgi:hypothetical protein